MSKHKPYTYVRLICSDDGDMNQRYEVRVSTFVQFDENAGRRAISLQPSKKQALAQAQEIARCELARTGGWKIDE
jgi:hypothetical protein